MRPGFGLGGMTHSLVVMLTGLDMDMGDMEEGELRDDMAVFPIAAEVRIGG